MKKFLCVAAFLVGCGGDDGGGSSDTRLLVELSPAEAQDLCEDVLNDRGARTVDCGDGVTFEVLTQEDCADISSEPVDPSCTATAGDFTDCIDAFYDYTDAQLCDPNTPPPPACLAIKDC